MWFKKENSTPESLLVEVKTKAEAMHAIKEKYHDVEIGMVVLAKVERGDS